MDKEDVVLDYYLAIKKNEILPFIFATIWKNLEGIMLKVK